MDLSTLEQRLWARVKKGEPDECWPWLGAAGTHGYGVMGTGDGKRTVTTHRLAYIITHGSIPDASGGHGGVVMHTCDNRRCCNPAHLVAGSQAENLRDMREKGRAYTGGPKGEAARTAVLTSEQVLQIRALSGRFNGVDLAKQFGVTPSAISSILTRKSWKHI